jgi:hypothetical protein
LHSCPDTCTLLQRTALLLLPLSWLPKQLLLLHHARTSTLLTCRSYLSCVNTCCCKRAQLESAVLLRLSQLREQLLLLLLLLLLQACAP